MPVEVPGRVSRLSRSESRPAGPSLEPAEVLVEGWDGVRVKQAETVATTEWSTGELYLTSQRLIHVDGTNFSVALPHIAELTLAGQRLLVSLRQGGGFVIEHSAAPDIRAAIAGKLKGQNPSR